METLEIITGRQMDGVVFAFGPLEQKELKQMFPDSKQLWKIFIAVDRKEEDLHPIFEKMIKYFLPAMIGVEKQSELKKIKKVKFRDPYKRILETTMEIN